MARIAPMAITAILFCFTLSTEAATICDSSLSERIPARASAAVTGHEFARAVTGISEDAREATIQNELLNGNMPEFLRHLLPITLVKHLNNGGNISVTICVAADYLAIGSDDDFMLTPMRLETALTIGNRYGFTLPTRKLVDAIYAQAQVHFAPQPLPAGNTMRSTEYYWHHAELISAQRSLLNVTGHALSSGQKKDLVITNRLWNNPERVAIYGWHQPNGKAIQPLSTVHGWRYADYSHGVRLISTQVWVNGQPQSIFDVLENPELADLISDEGVIPRVHALVEVLASHPTSVAGLVSTAILNH